MAIVIKRYTFKRKLNSFSHATTTVNMTKEQAEIYISAKYPDDLEHWHDLHDESLADYYRKDCCNIVNSRTKDHFSIDLEVCDETSDDDARTPQVRC